MTQLPHQNVIDYEKWVETKITTYFNGDSSKFMEFKKLLVECGGVISGSSVLSSVIPSSLKNRKDWSSMDIDVYVNIRNIPKILNFLVHNHPNYKTRKHGYYPSITSVRNKSYYCDSFLTRNKIQKVHKINLKRSVNDSIMKIDVMAVRNSQMVTNVVTNFDLTFCQIWYTGDAIFTSHPDHILNMRGVLQGDYTKTFLEGNAFLANRLTKYRRRGFEIHLDRSFMTTNGVLAPIKKNIETFVKHYESSDRKIKLITSNIFHEIYTPICNGDGYDSEEYDSIVKLREISKDEKVNRWYLKFINECPSNLVLEDAIFNYYENMYHASFVSPIARVHFEWLKNYISFVSITGEINSAYVIHKVNELEASINKKDMNDIRKRSRDDDDEDFVPPEAKRPRMS